MSFFSFLVSAVLAAEQILPNPWSQPHTPPTISFGTMKQQILGQTSVEENPEIPTRVARKSHFTIALLGDSMIDTLGTGEEMKTFLSDVYPDATFTILNYGVGSTNIQDAYKRLTTSYTYRDTDIPPLVSTSPDIVVLESCAYNPLPGVDWKNTHWQTLMDITQKLKTDLPHSTIVMATTIAPNSIYFAKGAPGVTMTTDERVGRAKQIQETLQITNDFAKKYALPLADTYSMSLDPQKNGDLTYINTGDHIHTSPEGRLLFAETIVRTILHWKLLE